MCTSVCIWLNKDWDLAGEYKLNTCFTINVGRLNVIGQKWWIFYAIRLLNKSFQTANEKVYFTVLQYPVKNWFIHITFHKQNDSKNNFVLVLLNRNSPPIQTQQLQWLTICQTLLLPGISACTLRNVVNIAFFVLMSLVVEVIIIWMSCGESKQNYAFFN